MRRLGFSNFIRKVEGTLEDDTILEAEGTGGWQYTRYDLIFKLATCQISWGEYAQGVHRLSRTERQALYNERTRLGIRDFFNHTVGCDQPMRIRLEQASEPESRNQNSEQQGTDTGASQRHWGVPLYDDGRELLQLISSINNLTAGTTSDNS